MPTATNPIDTPQQRQHEHLALTYFNHPEIVVAREEVRRYWLDLVQPSKDQLSCFDWAFEEVMFGAVIWALNQDPLYPKVITITRLAHQLKDTRIPGSRWGIDNPDSVYRVIPISGDESYIIRGRVADRRLVENYFTLWSPVMQTVGLLSGKDLVIGDDGYFEITVDREEANGRPNHIQSCEEAHEFYIRDVIFDWAQDRPNELSVERLGPPPKRPPFSETALLERVKEYMHKWATNTTRWNAQAMNKPANDFSFTIDRDSDGALRNQIYILGNFVLPDNDSAIVLEVNMGGAEYFIAPITNVWGTSNEIVTRNGCLNMAQSQANDDGSYTFVLSIRDPGVHNWLDPSGLHDGILTLRWAEFPNDQPRDDLGVVSRLVPLTALDSNLVAGTNRVTPAQREAVSSQRVRDYSWRLDEGFESE
ncbi:MAG: hypothetical protein HOC23_13765 [Halieaceae bacterium]|jgi:hypothetical protein|nr:hypothetical protein [Halieaceae bacterium]